MNTGNKSVEELLKPRRKMIIDFPGAKEQGLLIGNVLTKEDKDNGWRDSKTGAVTYNLNPENFPQIFKEVNWWEERTIEQLQSVKYVKVIKYRGYWREGDIAPVQCFEGGSIARATPMGYILQYNHYQPIFELAPATQKEFEQYNKNI